MQEKQPRSKLLLALLVILISNVPCRSAQPLRQVSNITRAAAETAGPTRTATAYTQVLIIGAGMAGVAAARQLTDAGVPVLLLEARHRAGGRLHSVKTQAGAVDLGAMWIHEAAPGNAVYDLAQQLSINMSQRHNYNSASLFNPDGSVASTMLYMATYTSFMSQVRGRITAMRTAANRTNTAPQQTPQSTATSQLRVASPVIDVPLSGIVSEWISNSRSRWREQQIPLANLIAHQQFQTLLNANMSELSSLRFGDAKSLPAVDVLLQPGYDSLVEKLLPGLPISYNTTVTSISQDSTGVNVTTANGTVLQAPYALVTLPLGVLKAKTVKFNPELPAAKQAAIIEMGMGVLDKLILVFPPDKVFWDKRVDFLAYARNDWSGKWSSWLNYYKMWGVPVLVALNPADTAQDLENMTDQEVIDDAMNVLKLTYGNSSTAKAVGGVPEPLEAHVTRWAGDPYARGAYSYYATGNPKNITDILAEPFGRVLFAGEAASHKPATVLGALLSGRREADRLQQLLGQ